jgi:hypothetical protein
MDVLAATGSYRQSQLAGKFNVRAHFCEALVFEKDSMWREGQNSAALEDFVQGQFDLVSFTLTITVLAFPDATAAHIVYW